MQTPGRDHRTTIIGCVLLGITLRLILASISIGTNDAGNWHRMASEVATSGLFDGYRSDPLMNHPPLPLLWARWALYFPAPRIFAFVMKLPAIAGDALAIWLLARIWLAREKPRLAIFAAVAMALSPIAILISGYHCNTDNLYAALGLLGVYLANDRKRFFLAGIALAGAINIKLISILLIPCVFSLCRSPRDFLRLFAGLAIGVIPFLPLIFAIPDVIQRNMLSYSSTVSFWGIAMILYELFQLNHGAKNIMDAYLVLGKFVVILSILALAGWNSLRQRFDGYELAALTMAIFLVLAPGFAPQYLVAPIPFMLAVCLPRSLIFGLLGGLYLLIRYWTALVAISIPLETFFQPDPSPPPGSIIALVAWGTLAELIISRLLQRIRKPSNFAPACV